MQYNDTTNKNGLLQDCEFWTNLGDAAITGNTLRKAQFTTGLNTYLDKAHLMILSSQDEVDFDDNNYTDYPMGTITMVSGQRDYDISTTEGLLRIKRVDIGWSGSTGEFYRANPIDSAEQESLGNDTDVDARYSKTDPAYDVVGGKSLFIYPRATATDQSAGALIRIEFDRVMDKFVVADTTQEPGFDRNFHRYLSIGASYDWLLVNKPQETTLISRLEAMLADYENKIREHYGRKQRDRKMIFTGAYDLEDYD